MADVAPKSGKKNRKHGRNGRSPAQKRYKVEQRWIKNKLRRLKRRVKQHPNDKIALTAFKSLSAKNPGVRV